MHHPSTRLSFRSALWSAGTAVLLTGLAACSDSPAAPDGSAALQTGKGNSADRLMVLADNPTILPGDTTIIRASRTAGHGRRPAPVSWSSLDGGTLAAMGDSRPTAATFSAGEAGSYRLVATSATFPGADTVVVTVASPSVSATITSLELRPGSGTVRTTDTLRFTAWGRTASDDSVPASVTLEPSRGHVRGMDYTCGVAGTYTVTAQLREHPSITTSSSVTVQAADAGTTDGLCPAGTTDTTSAADSTGSRLAAIVLSPAQDTVAAADTVHFRAYGITAAGDSATVSVTLHPDSGTVHGMDWVAGGSGRIRIRALDSAGTLADTSIITVTATSSPSTGGSTGTDTTASSGAGDTTVTSPPPPSNSTGSVAELPRTYLDTRYVAPTGRVISVAAGGDLQSAINSAARGDVIELAAGARFVGNYYLPAKAGSGWVTIRSATTLPAEGTRVTPSAAQSFAKIVTPNAIPALRTTTNAATNHYRIMGLELTSQASLTYAVVHLGDYSRSAGSLSDLPSDIVLDRVYVHGTPTMDLQRCVTLNSKASAVIDSWLSDCHYRWVDAQAIISWQSPGPFKIVNNHLEGASENLMFGGADPVFAGVVPSDIEIRRNHFYKPLTWKSAGIWAVKNLLELKNAQRVLIEGNVFENNWAEAQTGFAVVMKTVNQYGHCTWCVTQDVTFRYNRIINSPSGFNLAPLQAPNGGGGIPARRIAIIQNVMDQVGLLSQPGAERIFQLLGGLTYVTIAHNTALGENHAILFDGTPASTTNFVIRDNLLARGRYGVFGSGYSEGSSAINYYARGGTFIDNAIIAASSSIYPSGNFYPASTDAAGLLSWSSGDYTLSASSPYLTSASDGTMIGADAAQVQAQTRGVR